MNIYFDEIEYGGIFKGFQQREFFVFKQKIRQQMKCSSMKSRLLSVLPLIMGATKQGTIFNMIFSSSPSRVKMFHFQMKFFVTLSSRQGIVELTVFPFLKNLLF